MTIGTSGNSGPASDTAAASNGVGPAKSWLKPVVVALVLSAVAWVLIYLWVAVPGRWLANAPTQVYSGAQMSITRGVGYSQGGNFIVTATDPSGIAVITIETPKVTAIDYGRVRWRVVSVDQEATLATLWRSDSAVGKTLTAPLELYGDRTFETRLQSPDWSGRIEGIALLVQGPVRQPLFIESMTMDSMDAREVIADRLHDWFDFREWNGLSINAAVGGPVEQPVSLSLAAALTALTAIVGIVLVRSRNRIPGLTIWPVVATIVAITWIGLDARWLWSRFQQTGATASVFAGKSPREKHIADIDGYVYAFAEQVIARLPKSASRIYVAADTQYFGGRLAYHLYPHNAYMNHDSGALPASSRVKPGDYIVVFRRRGIKFDPANQMLSWDEQPPVRVDVLIAHQGNAAFRVR